MMAAYGLFTQGHGPQGTLEKLELSFKEPVSLRTVKAWRADYKERQAELETRLDAPFEWSRLTDFDVPAEGSRAVLDAYRFYLSKGWDESEPFTFRLARWVWRVSQALQPWDGPDPAMRSWDIVVFAREYATRQLATVVLRQRHDTADLDLFLACAPWTSLEALKGYHAVQDRLGSSARLRNVQDDYELLRRLKPDSGWIERLKPLMRRPKPEDLAQWYQQLLRDREGILPSQFAGYQEWLHLRQQGQEPPELWHVTYLHEVHVKAGLAEAEPRDEPDEPPFVARPSRGHTRRTRESHEGGSSHGQAKR